MQPSCKIFSLLFLTILLSACGGGGSNTGASEQNSSPYVLPYSSGSAFVVGQGNSTVGSHQVGSDQAFAYDFDMPIGTTIIASRGGIVIAVEEKFTDSNNVSGQENFVIIQHTDNTVAGYYHLTKNGALVTVGNSVSQGAVIARSGNSGDSSEPHLHFEVLQCQGCNTLPITFENTRAHPNGLIEGEDYEAQKELLL